MADTKISALTELTSVDADSDWLSIVDVSDVDNGGLWHDKEAAGG